MKVGLNLLMFYVNNISEKLRGMKVGLEEHRAEKEMVIQMQWAKSGAWKCGLDLESVSSVPKMRLRGTTTSERA